MSSQGFPPLIRRFQVAIANGQSLSAAFDLAGYRLIAVRAPAGLAGTLFTFQSSDDQVTYDNVYDDGGFEASAQALLSRAVALSAQLQNDLSHVQYGKVRTGSAAAPTNQTQDVVLTLTARWN